MGLADQADWKSVALASVYDLKRDVGRFIHHTLGIVSHFRTLSKDTGRDLVIGVANCPLPLPPAKIGALWALLTGSYGEPLPTEATYYLECTVYDNGSSVDVFLKCRMNKA